MTDHSLGQFLAACGARGPLRLVVESSAGIIERNFEQPFALIGRDPRADIRFDDPGLSNRHAYLQFIAGRLLFVDFKKKKNARQAGWLDPGQAIELGPIRLRLHESTPPADWFMRGTKLPYAEKSLLPVVLEIVGRGARTTWRMKRPLAMIGTSSGCKIRLGDDAISRFHCVVVHTPDGLWAIDLLSTNGSAINGERVRAAPLRDGDQLSVGNYTICPRFELTATSTAVLALPEAKPTAVTSEPTPATPSTLAPVQSLIPNATTGAMVASLSTDTRTDAELVSSPLVIQLTQLQQQMYAQMQQQMAEQFQHAMGLFVDAFWAMYREQSARVQQELKRIRRLTRELTTLQKELV